MLDSITKLLRRSRDTISVHVLIRGRIGEGWHDVDRNLRIPLGTTLGGLVEEAERQGVPMREALENSPHLAETLMLNGERCQVEENRTKVLENGDTVYLLAPVAGGSSG